MRQKKRSNNKCNSSSSNGGGSGAGGASNGKKKKARKRKLLDGEQHQIRRQTTGITVMAVKEAAGTASASASAATATVVTTASECDSINKITFFSRLSESILDEKGNVSVVTCTTHIPITLFLYSLMRSYHIIHLHITRNIYCIRCHVELLVHSMKFYLPFIQ